MGRYQSTVKCIRIESHEETCAAKQRGLFRTKISNLWFEMLQKDSETFMSLYRMWHSQSGYMVLWKWVEAPVPVDLKFKAVYQWEIVIFFKNPIFPAEIFVANPKFFPPKSYFLSVNQKKSCFCFKIKCFLARIVFFVTISKIFVQIRSLSKYRTFSPQYRIFCRKTENVRLGKWKLAVFSQKSKFSS